MTDSGSYKPPFRRYQATSGASDSTEDSVMSSDYQGQSGPQRANNRGGRDNMHGQGFVARGTNYGGRGGYATTRGYFNSYGGANGRGGYGYGGDRGNHGNGYRGGRGRGYDNGYGRGRGRGRGGYGNNFFQGRRNDQQQLDQLSDGPELYQSRDLENYFWGQSEDTTSADHHSTFHDSQARPGELAYVQLFTNANPRWAADHIVFAKSNLKLLPEYSTKKAEHSEWEIPKATDVAAKDGEVQPQPAQAREVNDGVDAGAAKSAAEGDEAGSASTTAVTEAATKEDKTEVTTPTDATQGGEAPQPTKQPSPVPSSRMAFSDVRNLPSEELQRLEEEQRQQRLARQQQQQQQSPVFPAIEPIDYTPGTHSPIAVFEERRSYYNVPGRFAFVGWYKVARVNVLAPHSAELVRMQQQKWERRDRYGNAVSTKARDAAAWNTALSTEWAVVKFEKLKGPNVPPVPAIEKLPEYRAKAEYETSGQQQAQTQGNGAVEGQVESGAKEGEPVVKVGAAAEADASLQDTVTDQLSKMQVDDKEAKTGATAEPDKGASGDLTGTVSEASQTGGSDKHHDVVHVQTEQEDSKQTPAQENATTSNGTTGA